MDRHRKGRTRHTKAFKVKSLSRGATLAEIVPFDEMIDAEIRHLLDAVARRGARKLPQLLPEVDLKRFFYQHLSLETVAEAYQEVMKSVGV